MNLVASVFLFICVAFITGVFFYLLNVVENEKKLNETTCNLAGGYWDSCGNKCELMNVGNISIVCTQVCEEICGCGTIKGYTCPEGYVCITPENVVDAMGYCKKE